MKRKSVIGNDMCKTELAQLIDKIIILYISRFISPPYRLPKRHLKTRNETTVNILHLILSNGPHANSIYKSHLSNQYSVNLRLPPLPFIRRKSTAVHRFRHRLNHSKRPDSGPGFLDLWTRRKQFLSPPLPDSLLFGVPLVVVFPVVFDLEKKGRSYGLVYDDRLGKESIREIDPLVLFILCKRGLFIN
ncbi:hypothetical protein NPIL_502651 [Nephila pilipes]|uniref:Uncharacterized protein n=1 Tax=Nephila pilipes TaxID=299642 RepID=A0A8X6Q5S4_NEPPI|nr:hypothetical protein NPIL_502651 [Nephila pilipes]